MRLRAILLAISALPALAAARPYGQANAWTTSSSYSASSWDTSHAGTPLPSLSRWTNDYSYHFNDGPNCPGIAAQIFPPARNTTAKVFVSGAAITGLCASGAFVFTQAYNGSAWSGVDLRSAALNGIDGYRHSVGYYEVQSVLPPQTVGLIPYISIMWEEARLLLTAYNPYQEMDGCEVGLLSMNPTACSTTALLWPQRAPSPGQTQIKAFKQIVPSFNQEDGTPHTNGILDTHDETIIYYDRLEVGRFPKHNWDTRQATVAAISFNFPFVQPTDTTQTYTMTIDGIDSWVPPLGTCYYSGGC